MKEPTEDPCAFSTSDDMSLSPRDEKFFLEKAGLNQPPIPDFLSHLKTFAGMPVPYAVFWQNGKADFRITDRAKQIECHERSLCVICGKHMNRFWFIGGPASMDSGMFTDGPMHRRCAEYSATACPFLNGTRQHHSQRPAVAMEPHTAIVTNAEVPTERPEKMGLREAGSFEFGWFKDSMVYQVSSWRGKPIWF